MLPVLVSRRGFWQGGSSAPHTDERKAGKHLVSVGHVSTATKLGVEAGLEHGKSDGEVGRFSSTRQVNATT